MESSYLMSKKIPKQSKRAVIEAALPQLRFRKIGNLFYAQQEGNDSNEIEEFTGKTGLRISSKGLPVTMLAGNRVANEEEIWLHSDGSLHKYLWTASWESYEGGCSQRQYIAQASDHEVSMADLKEAIEFNISDDELDEDSMPF